MMHGRDYPVHLFMAPMRPWWAFKVTPDDNDVPLAFGRETEVVDRVSERAANQCPLLGATMGICPLLGMLDPAQP